MKQHDIPLNQEQLKELGEQIERTKSRYEHYEGEPRPQSLIFRYVPPVIGFIGIFPAYATLKALDYAGCSSMVQFGAGIVVFLAFTSGLTVYVRNKLIKNPHSRWRYLQQLY